MTAKAISQLHGNLWYVKSTATVISKTIRWFFIICQKSLQQYQKGSSDFLIHFKKPGSEMLLATMHWVSTNFTMPTDICLLYSSKPCACASDVFLLIIVKQAYLRLDANP